MIVLACLAAVLAALAGVVAPASSRRRLRPAKRRVRAAGSGVRWLLVAVAVTGASGVLAAVRLQVGMLAWCAATLSLTLAWLWTRRHRRRRAERAAAAVARACQIVAAESRLGRVPVDALRVAAEDEPLLRPVIATQRLGGDVASALATLAEAPGCAGLATLGRAWAVSGRTGAPLADLVAVVAADLRASGAVTRVVNGELAAPRATSQVLAVLPLFGLVLGHLVGAEPLAFLLQQPLGLACLAAGVALTCAGLLWSHRLAAGAERSIPRSPRSSIAGGSAAIVAGRTARRPNRPGLPG